MELKCIPHPTGNNDQHDLSKCGKAFAWGYTSYFTDWL